MEMDQNPFAPPQTDAQTPFTAATTDAEAETIRRQFLSHESSVRAIGALYLLGAFLMIAGGIAFLTLGLSGDDATGGLANVSPLTMVVFALMLLVILLVVWIGWGLRQLNNAARIGGIVYGSLNVLGALLQFNPILLLIQILFLYYLASAKGRYVCSEEYREISLLTRICG